MIANLPMYQRPELETAHNNFWTLIRNQLQKHNIQSPDALSQDAEEMHVWQHPNLTLSQTCSMPYRLWLHDKVTLIGTPDYNLGNCPPGYYRSALITHKDDPRTHITQYKDATFAYNQTHSQSGYAAPYFHTQPHNFWFKHRLQTHAHLASAKAIINGQADIAAIDAVSWRLIQQYEPTATNLKILDWTTPTPGLPYITAQNNDPKTYFAAINQAIQNLTQKDQETLGIQKLIYIPKQKYLNQSNPKE